MNRKCAVPEIPSDLRAFGDNPILKTRRAKVGRFIASLFVSLLLVSLTDCGLKDEQQSLTNAPQGEDENLTPEQARKELQDRNIEFSEYSFLFRIRERRTTLVKLFLKAGMNPDVVDTHHILSGSRQQSAFMYVVNSGSPDMALAFIKAGADPNAKDSSGFTALMHASLQGEIKVVDALIEAGADVNASVGSGTTPLILAVGGGTPPEGALVGMMFRALGNLQEGLNENARPRQDVGTSPIPESASAEETVRALIRAGADVNVQTAHGDTPLMYAAHTGRAGMVQILLENGADPNMKNMIGETALMVAQRKGYKDIVELLR